LQPEIGSGSSAVTSSTLAISSPTTPVYVAKAEHVATRLLLVGAAAAATLTGHPTGDRRRSTYNVRHNHGLFWFFLCITKLHLNIHGRLYSMNYSIYSSLAVLCGLAQSPNVG